MCAPSFRSPLDHTLYTFIFQKHQYLREIAYLQDDFFGKSYFPLYPWLFLLYLSPKISFFLPLRKLASSPFNFMLKPIAPAWPGFLDACDSEQTHST